MPVTKLYADSPINLKTMKKNQIIFILAVVAATSVSFTIHGLSTEKNRPNNTIQSADQGKSPAGGFADDVIIK